jgi:MGT family glycosyltransferase
VCADALSWDACVASQLENVPWATAAVLMMSVGSPEWRFPFKDIAEELTPEIIRLMTSLGADRVEMASTDVVSPWLNMLFSTEALFPRALSGNRHSTYVGPSRPLGRRGDEPEFPWEKIRDDVPLVYVSSGGGHALSYDAATYSKICSSLGPNEAQFVCALGELAQDPAVRDFPENVIGVPYAPQVTLLERHASVAVSHGGVNSTNEALLHARPLLVVPIAHEQPLQAFAIARSGAGLSLDLATLSKEACRAALLRLLRERSFHREASRVRDSFVRQNGATAAAELLCRLAQEGRPLAP